MNYLNDCFTLGGGTLHLHTDLESGVFSLIESLPGGKGQERKFEVMLSEANALQLYKALAEALLNLQERKRRPVSVKNKPRV